jgi:hypothetical protein
VALAPRMIDRVEPITLHHRFRPWRYGVGHSQLLLHAHADHSHREHTNVLFEDVRAVKLRSSFQPLILLPADAAARAGALTFAEVPERHRFRYLCLILPTDGVESGFIICARATVMTLQADSPGSPYTWSDDWRILHSLTPQDLN